MILHDLKFAWRLFVRRPAFTAVAILILALGIGANATIFSWVETVLLNPLTGVVEQDRLVALRGTHLTGRTFRSPIRISSTCAGRRSTDSTT